MIAKMTIWPHLKPKGQKINFATIDFVAAIDFSRTKK